MIPILYILILLQIAAAVFLIFPFAEFTADWKIVLLPLVIVTIIATVRKLLKYRYPSETKHVEQTMFGVRTNVWIFACAILAVALLAILLGLYAWRML